MKNLVIKKLAVIGLMFGMLFTQACTENNDVVEPELQTQQEMLTDEQLEEAVEITVENNAEQAVVMNDLAKIAMYGSPEGVEEADDLIGLIQNDSTLVYEGEHYVTTVVYDIKYKIGNRIVEEYSPLADTALIHYTIHSAFDNVQYHGEKFAESIDFKVSGIKMPTTHFRIDLLSEFSGYLEYFYEPHVKLSTVGNSYFENVIMNIYTAEIESGTGGIEFDLQMLNQTIGTYYAEIEFLGNNEVKVDINGKEYTFTIDPGSYLP